MAKQSKYQSHPADPKGYVQWQPEENRIWQDLYQRQMEIIPGQACDEYLQGLERLNLPTDRVPQLPDVSRVLKQHTGWEVTAVPALINFTDFFTLLANKEFPVATFIRRKEDFDYLQEPDIFHEIFGHCPLLTNPAFAHFTHVYGKLGLTASKEDRAFLARLYWFTVEFGLLKTAQGLRIYGGGILSSPGETIYALESTVAERHSLKPLDVLRTPYRIDIMQPVYYVINHLDELFSLAESDIMALVQEAKQLGLFAAKFPPKDKVA